MLEEKLMTLARRLLVLIIAAAAALACAPALAASAAVVEGVQMPAWVVRHNRQIPLAPGMALQGGDEVRTGEGARVYIKLPEGSLVKLGEKASFRLIEAANEKSGLFRSIMDVLEGAFRFTTDALSKARRRQIDIRVRTVTAGIRGTDLWGKSSAERQVVCLIEGRIGVKPEGEAEIAMDQPLSFYVREHGASKPVAPVAAAQLAQWAAETDIAAGAGAARRGGRYSATLARVGTQAEALAAYDRLRAAGYPAEIAPRGEGAAIVYEVRIRHLASKREADALAARLAASLGLAAPAR